jgi:hypothetical protein
MQFLEVLQNLSVNSSLPFSLDFAIKPRGVTQKNKKLQCGVEVPIYDTLLVREKAFIESYITDINRKRNKLEQQIEKLAYKLNIELELNSMVVARALANGTSDEIKDKVLVAKFKEVEAADNFQSWKALNIDLFAELIDGITSLASESVRDYFLITIFMASRTFGGWDFADTMNLTVDESKEILTLFYSESGANNETNEVIYPEVLPDVVQDLGKD